MVELVIELSRLLQVLFPLPDWTNGDDVAAWLSRIAGPLGRVIAVIIRRAGSLKFLSIQDELASPEAKQALAGVDQKYVDAAIQILLILQELEDR